MKNKTKRPPSSVASLQTPQPATEGVQERIRLRAYELCQQGGCEHGRDVEHWKQAELEVAGDPSQKRSPTAN
jgi:hypothetical protein